MGNMQSLGYVKRKNLQDIEDKEAEQEADLAAMPTPEGFSEELGEAEDETRRRSRGRASNILSGAGGEGFSLSRRTLLGS